MIKYLENAADFKEIISKGTVLVDFYADWCGPCRMLGPVLEKLSKERTDVTVLKVDVDTFGALSQQFSVFSIPTMILFKDGKPVGKQVGYKAFSQLVDFIDNN
ncbi:MAG: thioredoxin [Bacilli bacterium]|jgi:thioredoxin 1|nr:thioredoxin [Bacillota bacterium]NLI52025.1 thioredoxin [Erysipelotrichaceae bacterium]OQC50501.1 MAG: Thioredoxin [Tenericutes bacterium ADurb.Bin024]HOA11162.1 thioredoxin [Bacilli bacterium]HOE53888.1 thioredoxin [Bacilli bacterium]